MKNDNENIAIFAYLLLIAAFAVCLIVLSCTRFHPATPIEYLK